MGFHDDPIVDSNSKLSEESVNAVRSYFTRKSGFILREENPDYGVDLDIELVLDETRASSKKFAVQIKSTVVVNKLKKADGIFSLPFTTSRLGYLAGRSPAYGIIVVYEETTEKCYFDYVEDIIARIDEVPDREGWRDQDSVSILLPLNELTADRLREIHQKFTRRHENHDLLIRERGAEFNIPYLKFFEMQSPDRINLKDPSQVADFLVKFGGFLFNENEYQSLGQMLGVLGRSQIDRTPELIFLSAILYTQTGKVIEAEYYLRKARKISNSLTDEQNSLIGFSEIRLDFLKGDINYHRFVDRLKSLKGYTKSIENQLTLEINIVFFNLINTLENRDDANTEEINKQIDALLKKIEAAEIPEAKKQLLKIYHSESQHTFAINLFINQYARFKIKENLHVPVPIAERLFYAQLTLTLTNAAVETAFKAYRYADDSDLALLKGYAAHHLAKYFFTLNSTLLFIADDDAQIGQIQSDVGLYETNQNLSLIAYNQFLNLGMYKSAHEALGTAYDLLYLCRYISDQTIGPKSAEELSRVISEIEAAYDIQPFESAAERVIETVQDRSSKEESFLKNASDTEIVYMAERIREGYNLPSDRLSSIVDDLKMNREFQNRCSNPEIQMLQDKRHMASAHTFYKTPPPYVLWHKKLDIHTKPSTDIEVLLKEFETILNK